MIQPAPAGNESDNERSNKKSTRREDEGDSEQSSHGGMGFDPEQRRDTFLNFMDAQTKSKKKKVAERERTRYEALKELIELEAMQFDMFDLKPVTDYDLFIKRQFGDGQRKQASCQTGDDDIESEVQTEVIEMCEVWTQGDDVGGGNVRSGDGDGDKMGGGGDVMALTNFLSAAGQVVGVLLDDERIDVAGASTSSHHQQQQQTLYFSEKSFKLGDPTTLPWLQGRKVMKIDFSHSQTNLLLTLHSMPQDKLYNQGMICVWNVNDPSEPIKILTCHSQPTCCCFSPEKATLVFSGCADGSLVVWDLREDASTHHPLVWASDDEMGNDKGRWVGRAPTYSTAGSLSAEESHHSSITSIIPIITNLDIGGAGDVNSSTDGGPAPGDATTGDAGAGGGSTDGAAGGTAGGLSFQLATIEAQAVIHLWVVIELTKASARHAWGSDYGLTPGGRVKLMKASFLTLESPVSFQAYDMQLWPEDPNHFFVGTDTGFIMHGVKYGGRAPPSLYRGNVDVPVEIRTLHFSTFNMPYFLVGCMDGSVRLYFVERDLPLIEWGRGKAPIIQVHPSPSRPSIHYTLDSSSRLHIWDILKSDAVPIHTEHFKKARSTCFALSNDHQATGQGTAGRPPQIAMAFENGEVEIHYISRKLREMGEGELAKVEEYLKCL